jgi:hypothetical protein
MADQPQPGLLEKILSHVPAVCQPGEKVKQPRVERRVHGIKSVRIAGPKTVNELQFELTIHRGTNADERVA